MRTADLKQIPFDSAPYRGLEFSPFLTVRQDVLFGGPTVEPTRDRRFYLEAKALEALLDLARQSPTGRVVIHHGGLRVRQVQDGGSVVEVLSIVGDNPTPEPFPFAGVR